MPPRLFSLANPQFDIPVAVGLQFGWGGINAGVASQIAFQEQFLHFYKYLYQNLQSVPVANPNLNPMGLSLSLRAGALKAYVLIAVSIMEGAIAELAFQRALGNQAALHRRPFGALLNLIVEAPAVRQEFDPVWNNLQLLKTYRNFIHLGNAANVEAAYWQDILNHEADILAACDAVIPWLSGKCDGNAP